MTEQTKETPSFKIFTEEDSFEKRVNFVDENNLYVGYNLHGQTTSCDEHPDWYISDYPEDQEGEKPASEELDGWVFDQNYCEEFNYSTAHHTHHQAVFRLTKKGTHWKDKYLHLKNVHNGYYAHDYFMEDKDSEEKVYQGHL